MADQCSPPSQEAPKRSARLFEKDGQEWLRITVEGKVTEYYIEDLRPDPKVAYPAYRLHRDMGKIVTEGQEKQVWLQYDISKDRFGAVCTCGDFEFRKACAGQPCKHIAALRAVGLVPKE